MELGSPVICFHIVVRLTQKKGHETQFSPSSVISNQLQPTGERQK